MDLYEKTVRKNYVYEGKIINVRCDDALQADGKPCKREIIEHSGGACALYIKDGKALLVKQYRYAYGEDLYEIPAGKLEKGEAPMLAAARELKEEAGVTAKKLTLLYITYPTPGYTNEKIYIYKAEDGEDGEAAPDDGEFLTAEYIPLERVKEMMRSGEIKDGKTLIALLAYFGGFCV